MGYCVKIIESSFSIKKENCDEAFRVVCELNRYDDLKTGGQWGDRLPCRPADSKSVFGNPAKWFCGMSWNYDETCASLAEVLAELGFIIEEAEDEIRILGVGEYAKCGQEDLFLNALAPYVEPGSFLIWLGEDGSSWRHEFENGQMIAIEC